VTPNRITTAQPTSGKQRHQPAKALLVGNKTRYRKHRHLSTHQFHPDAQSGGSGSARVASRAGLSFQRRLHLVENEAFFDNGVTDDVDPPGGPLGQTGLVLSDRLVDRGERAAAGATF
jgi:hypothetical protein